ncbi:MAG: hypothetical protein HYR89_03550 [Actinobacteria bacterium]|nr:hypothetical protein [Actinomycetota bacterium]
MAAGYRLAGDVLDHVCCRQMYGPDRLPAVWPATDHAVVIAVGRHDESAEDVYTALLDALDRDVPTDEREKPPCCDDEGLPPADEEIATSISEAIEHRTRERRRAR